ncbi:coiled-coil domain-containing protein 55-domain containing protein [Panaeolus papilionaceus]|nr:coiled-coil domain-containing protein 55-domain containing protein [Panaeolus papilionaceus]
MQKRIQAEKLVDSTAYEYDEVWESMKEAKAKQQIAKEKESAERKPKYIQSLLASAATRKLDHLRAEEKMMQREREQEGDEFKDKETFVTQAYKDQMEQVRKAEAEEKEREEQRKKQQGLSTGMSHFYRQLLEQSEEQHEVTMAATQKRTIGPQGPNLTITKPPEQALLSDVELAKLAREQGKDVELNDDNRIVDKRELLSAGLNLSLPNTRNLALQNAKNNPLAEQQPAAVHRAVGTAASKREIAHRRIQEAQRQMEEAREATEKEKRQSEQRTTRAILAKRNNDAEVESARERYLARKRQRLEGNTASTEGI